MAWLTVDKDGSEKLHLNIPLFGEDGMFENIWFSDNYIYLHKGDIEELLGYTPSYTDIPVEI